MAAINIKDFMDRYGITNRRDVFRLKDKGLIHIFRWYHDYYVCLIVLDEHELYHFLALKI